MLKECKLNCNQQYVVYMYIVVVATTTRTPFITERSFVKRRMKKKRIIQTLSASKRKSPTCRFKPSSSKNIKETLKSYIF